MQNMISSKFVIFCLLLQVYPEDVPAWRFGNHRRQESIGPGPKLVSECQFDVDQLSLFYVN